MNSTIPDTPHPVSLPDSNSFKPFMVALFFLVIACLTSVYFLLSASESLIAVDGAIDWRQESPLRAIVQLLCLNYQFGTLNAGDIKLYAMNMACGVGLLAAAISLISSNTDAAMTGGPQFASAGDASRAKKYLPLLLAMLFVMWSFVSARWSSAPSLATGGSILIAMAIAWAMLLGESLTRQSVALILRGTVIICALSALVSIWYFYGRNPNLRAKFPFGNPNFLAAAMVPGVIGALSLALSKAQELRRCPSVQSWVMAAVYVFAVSICLWAIKLSDSRATMVGLGCGVYATVFAMSRRRARVALIGLGLALGIAAFIYVRWAGGLDGSFSRLETLQFRFYSWSYAWRMFLSRPLIGFGQGGFVLHGDSHAANDVLLHPQVFENRIEHAHSEWLEILADLGLVGFILFGGLIFIILLRLFGKDDDVAAPRHSLAPAFVGILIAFIVQESFGVGLRSPDVIPIFFTVIGLAWAVSRDHAGALVRLQFASTVSRLSATVLLAALGILTLVLSQQDFVAARNALRADQALHKGDIDGAISHAGASVARLNPQRALVSLLRLGEAHVSAAEKNISMALERTRRASEAELPAAHLARLADANFIAAENQVKQAERTFQDLIAYSPKFMDSGRLEYRICMVLAQLAERVNDAQSVQRHFSDAFAALERESARQPFDPWVAVTLVRTSPAPADPALLLNFLARPLRYQRMNEMYAELLTAFAHDSQRYAALAPEMEKARRLGQTQQAGLKGEDWIPEKLRISAAVAFLSGDYESAVNDLSLACPLYSMPGDRNIASASCRAELADAQFFANPLEPQTALKTANIAIDMCPESFPGRQLADLIRSRTVHYLLAADEESAAFQVLRRSASPSVKDESLQTELGARLRRLSESLMPRLLNQEQNEQQQNALIDALREQVKKFSARAMELSPQDPQVYLLGAQVAWMENNFVEVARLLEKSVSVGLPSIHAFQIIARLESRGPIAELAPLREKISQTLQDTDATAPPITP